MSSLNSFRKKRELSKKDLIKRKNGHLKEFKRILIVTEGSETEPLYFEQIKRKYKLKDNVIFIYPAENSSPRDVLKTAKDKNSIDDFDKVFCVFDKDTHDTYDEVVLKITNDKKLVKFTAVTSVPCFEFWLILHYKATAKPYYTSDKNKASKNALKDLQKIDPMYSKNNKNYFEAIVERTDIAIKNADIVSKQVLGDDPSTKIPTLINEIKELSRKINELDASKK
uniref:RloB family protein n=1 Tax=Succinivibrio sp. TaxID=2053619 RepID=UPI00402A9EB6